MTAKYDAALAEARARLARGDFIEAGRSYRNILRRRPGDTEALYALGVIRLQAGKPAEAIAFFRRALDSGLARTPDVLENLGTAHLISGNTQSAERELCAAIAAGGTRAVLRMRLGMALAAQGRLQEAESELRVAQKQDPADPDIGLNLGNVLASQGRSAEAFEQFQRLVKRDSLHLDALYNIGTLYREEGRFEEAVDAYSKVLSIAPDHIGALNNLGTIRERMGDMRGAVGLYRKVLEIDPRNVHAYCNLASTFRQQGLLEQATQSCQRALELQPEFVDALFILGAVRAEQGNIEAARCAYKRAAEKGDPEACCRYGMFGLALGGFKDSWLYYQARATRRHMLKAIGSLDSELPVNLEGKKILIIGEQGLGDELFFLRCSILLKQQKSHLICVCDGKIQKLLERTGLFDTLLTYGDPLPPRDLTIAAGDLPMLLSGVNLVSGPASLKPLPLWPLPERIRSMQNYLARIGPPPYLAVTWRSGTPLADQRTWRDGLLSKEVPLDRLAPALRGFQGTIISLQRNPGKGEATQLAALTGATIYDGSAINDDLEDVLALLSLLHEYVGVSNTNMHLMGGLGKRARVLVPNPPEWRWMATGDESPWFPGFVLYRQAVDRTWGDAMARLRRDLSVNGE